MDRRAWWAAVCVVTESGTWLSMLAAHHHAPMHLLCPGIQLVLLLSRVKERCPLFLFLSKLRGKWKNQSFNLRGELDREWSQTTGEGDGQKLPCGPAPGALNATLNQWLSTRVKGRALSPPARGMGYQRSELPQRLFLWQDPVSASLPTPAWEPFLLIALSPVSQEHWKWKQVWESQTERKWSELFRSATHSLSTHTHTRHIWVNRGAEQSPRWLFYV